MTTSGYSQTPLIKKLGFVPESTLLVKDTPEWYVDFANDNGVDLVGQLPATQAHIFFHSQKELDDFLTNYDLEGIEKSLWVSWPKQASKVPTDLTEQSFRDAILPLGWVDIKVAAIDETWSGLKFTRRRIAK